MDGEKMDVSNYLPYIDVNDCLNRIRGNKKLCAMLLKSFKANPHFNEAKAAALAGDLGKAQMEMHTLKGMAANLSLKRLYDLVVPVEMTLKSEMVPPEKLTPVEEALNKTLELIDALVAEFQAEGAI